MMKAGGNIKFTDTKANKTERSNIGGAHNRRVSNQLISNKAGIELDVEDNIVYATEPCEDELLDELALPDDDDDELLTVNLTPRQGGAGHDRRKSKNFRFFNNTATGHQ